MIVLENIYNKDKFECKDMNRVRFVDGIEYLRVNKPGTHREVWVRKDFLKKVG